MSKEKPIPEKTWNRDVTQSLSDAVSSVWGINKDQPVDAEQEEVQEATKMKKPSKIKKGTSFFDKKTPEKKPKPGILKNKFSDEALDPVGKADKDIDNDGDTDDSDRYLANRRKKIAAAIKANPLNTAVGIVKFMFLLLFISMRVLHRCPQEQPMASILYRNCYC